MIKNATSEELESLLSNPNGLELLSRSKVKKQIAEVNGNHSEVVSFWKQGENWISEEQLIAAAEFLASMGLIRYVATEFSLIVEVKR